MKKYLCIYTLLIIALTGRSQVEKSMSRELLHSTVRIEVETKEGTGTGTGFFFSFPYPEKKSSIPVIVTCWHVVSGSLRGRMVISSSDNETNSSQQTAYFPNFEQFWIRHPDTNVDLTIMPIASLLKMLDDTGRMADIAPLGETLIPHKEEIAGYSIFQEIKFIGYPIGLWDQKNNLPIARRGMIATDPSVDFNGRSEFLIDGAAYPGSSGSPVFIADEGGYTQGSMHVMGGQRLRLLGVLYGGPEWSADGKVEIIVIPTVNKARIKTDVPINLGCVIKASRLSDFRAKLDEIVLMQDKLQRAIDAQKTNNAAK